MYPKMTTNTYSRLDELLKRTGYHIIQQNGQRIYSNPANNNNDNISLPRGCEVFVGRLPRDIFEDVLVPMFESVGVIYKLRLMMDFNGKNRGFCFVTYLCKEIANAAVEYFDGYEIRPGCNIGVFKSLDNTRLFVGGIPVDKSKEEVMLAFGDFVEGIRDVIMYPSNVNQDINRGYVFIEFESHRYAAIARRRLQPGSLILWGSAILVDWAEPLPDPDPTVMSMVTKLYCRNLSVTMSSESFQSEIAKFISMQSVVKVHKMNDFAFIHFQDRAAAEEGIKNLTDVVIGGRKAEITWARPEIYSNNYMRQLEPNHFCLSIPAKVRRVIRMRQKLKKSIDYPMMQNSMIFSNNCHRHHMPMPIHQALPAPIAYPPNFVGHKSNLMFNLNGINFNGFNQATNQYNDLNYF